MNISAHTLPQNPPEAMSPMSLPHGTILDPKNHRGHHPTPGHRNDGRRQKHTVTSHDRRQQPTPCCHRYRTFSDQGNSRSAVEGAMTRIRVPRMLSRFMSLLSYPVPTLRRTSRASFQRPIFSRRRRVPRILTQFTLRHQRKAPLPLPLLRTRELKQKVSSMPHCRPPVRIPP